MRLSDEVAQSCQLRILENGSTEFLSDASSKNDIEISLRLSTKLDVVNTQSCLGSSSKLAQERTWQTYTLLPSSPLGDLLKYQYISHHLPRNDF